LKIFTSKEIHPLISESIKPIFDSMLSSGLLRDEIENWTPKKIDWAVHPDGRGLLQGIQEAMDLSSDQLRASYEVYKMKGNSQSATVLIVLDKLRRMGEGRDNLVACSNGPGLTIEMIFIKRCRK
jgi:type III polyketide synthase